MRYLIILLLSGCTLSAQKQDADDIEFNKLINKAKENQNTFYKVSLKAKEKEDRLVSQAINKIATLKQEVKAVRIDTIYIHDTIEIKEKKNFWGKTKTDTLNNK